MQTQPELWSKKRLRLEGRFAYGHALHLGPVVSRVVSYFATRRELGVLALVCREFCAEALHEERWWPILRKVLPSHDPQMVEDWPGGPRGYLAQQGKALAKPKVR
jgi:hypothetical protein